MGLDVLIASQGEHSLVTEVNAGLHINIDRPEVALETILQEASNKAFAGLLGSDDSTVELAALAAQKLGLTHNPPAAARLTRRKDLARAQLKLAGCAVPAHCLLNLNKPVENQLGGVPWPCVIKPLNMSASRGVIRCNNKTEFIAACQRVKKIIAESTDDFEQSHILVEDYIDGFEVAFEGFMHNGALNTLTIFDKPVALEGPYFEETIYVTPSAHNEATLKRIYDSVSSACKAYGFITGPIHAELRIDENAAWILEVAARTIGGDCARILDSSDGVNLEKLTLLLAMGEKPTYEPVTGSKGVMMIPVEKGGLLRRVEGLNNARKIAGIDKVEIIIPESHELVPLPEGNRYPGYIFAHGNTQQQVIKALNLAHQELNIVTAPVWKLAANEN